MSAHHRTKEYQATSRKYRRIFGAQVKAGVAYCWRCGQPIEAGQLWDVGHVLDIALGGDDSDENLRIEHRNENRSRGGTAGAKKVNAKRRSNSGLLPW